PVRNSPPPALTRTDANAQGSGTARLLSTSRYNPHLVGERQPRSSIHRCDYPWIGAWTTGVRQRHVHDIARTYLNVGDCRHLSAILTNVNHDLQSLMA